MTINKEYLKDVDAAEKQVNAEFKALTQAATHVRSCLRLLVSPKHSRLDANRVTRFSKRQASETTRGTSIPHLKNAIIRVNAAKKDNAKLIKLAKNIRLKIKKAMNSQDRSTYFGNAAYSRFASHEGKIMNLASSTNIRLDFAASSLKVAVHELQSGMVDKAKNEINAADNYVRIVLKIIHQFYAIEREVKSDLRLLASSKAA